MLTNKIVFENIYKIIPKWRWCELLVALERSLISERDIISYSIFVLSEDTEQFDKVVALSIAEDEEVKKIICELAGNEVSKDTELINDKWMFAIIYDAYIRMKDKIYDIIDDVYSEFSYPRKISNLISYMPNDDGKLMEEKLIQYINEGRRIWC